jgi:hypothetical protein
VQEFVHVRARRRGRDDAVARGREVARLLRPLIAPGDAELALGLQLYEEHERLSSFDAVLAATVMLSGADVLVSADRALGRVPGLVWLDPAGPEVGRLVSG